MKIFFRTIHLYLGLAAGLVIMTCCFTGAVLVFEKELQEAFNHNRYYVKEQNLHLPIQQLVNSVKQKVPTAKIASIKIYPDPKRSVEIGVSISEKSNHKGRKEEQKTTGVKERNDRDLSSQITTEKNGNKQSELTNPQVAGKVNKNAKQQQGVQAKGAAPAGAGGRATHTAFVNPYSGEVLELYSYRETFFYTMFSLHRWLLGSDSSIGKTITGISTIIFLFILITGIVLWWPRNKAILKQRLKIKTDASFKRLNHDLHIVLGFYSAIFLFIFAFTALAWSFKWFNDGIYRVTGSSQKPAKPVHSVFDPTKEKINYDSAFVVVSNIVPQAQYYTLRAPGDSIGIFTATVLPTGVHESAADNYYIDQYSGKVIGYLRFQDKNLGQRARATFKPVHVGSIFGLPSKIIAFVVCLLGVSFPVTGTIMWLNRLKKNRKRKLAAKEGRVVLVEDEDYEYEDAKPN